MITLLTRLLGLVNRDPYIGLWNNPHIIGWYFIPLFHPKPTGGFWITRKIWKKFASTQVQGRIEAQLESVRPQLKKTASLPLKIGRNDPKGRRLKANIFQPTIHFFRGENGVCLSVSGRVCLLYFVVLAIEDWREMLYFVDILFTHILDMISVNLLTNIRACSNRALTVFDWGKIWCFSNRLDDSDSWSPNLSGT